MCGCVTIRSHLIPLMQHPQIREAIARHGITPYTCPIDSDDEETTKGNIDIMVGLGVASLSACIL